MIPTMDYREASKLMLLVLMTSEKLQLCVLPLSGILLQPQILYKGKTNACHPNIQFPADCPPYNKQR